MDWSLITLMSNTNTRKRKTKNDTSEIVRKSLKHSSGFLFSLLVNVIIVYAVVRIFSYSFNFAYNVFGDVAKDPGSTEHVVVEISNDTTALKIGEGLEDAGIIDDKYVFYIKMSIKKYSGKIVPGKYVLSPSMKFEDIAKIICDLDEDKEEK